MRKTMVRAVICPLLFTLALYSLLPMAARAMPYSDSNTVNTGTILHYQWLLPRSQTCSNPQAVEGNALKQLPFSSDNNLRFQKGLGSPLVDEYLYLKFRLTNPEDSASRLVFFPGVYFRDAQIYWENAAGTITRMGQVMTNSYETPGYYSFTVAAHEEGTVYVRVKPSLASTSVFKPVLILQEDMSIWISYFRTVDLPLRTFSFIVIGMLIMMICYAIIHFFQAYRRQFLYYKLYATFMAALFFLFAYENRTSSEFNFIVEEWLGFVLQMVAYFFYFLFIRYFLETRVRYKQLDKLCEYSQYLILLCVLVYSSLYFGGASFKMLRTIEIFSKYFLLAFGLAIVIGGLKNRDRVFKYVMSGNLVLILFSVFSLLMGINNLKPFGKGTILNRSLFYYEAGVAAELLFFLMGLSYKNRKELVQRTAEKEKLKLENKRQEFNKQLAILQAQQEERNRISRDIHDELGGGMTAIRLMSELVKERMKNQQIPEIEKISASANDLLTKMNAIVWSMTHSNDSVGNLVAYIRNYAMEFFENTPIECRVEAPQEIPSLEMSGEKRRNIFLALKETLNNTLKHSGASQVMIRIDVNSQLEISVHDNGRGLKTEKLRQFGTGLLNIKKRMDSIYGRFLIESRDGAFTLLAVDIQ